MHPGAPSEPPSIQSGRQFPQARAKQAATWGSYAQQLDTEWYIFLGSELGEACSRRATIPATERAAARRVAWPMDRPARSHACPASKDTHARASAVHYAGADMASMPQAKCRHGQANKQSIKACNQQDKASTALRAGWHVEVKPRHPRRPRSICAEKRKSGGAQPPVPGALPGAPVAACGHCRPCESPRARSLEVRKSMDRVARPGGTTWCQRDQSGCPSPDWSAVLSSGMGVGPAEEQAGGPRPRRARRALLVLEAGRARCGLCGKPTGVLARADRGAANRRSCVNPRHVPNPPKQRASAGLPYA